MNESPYYSQKLKFLGLAAIGFSTMIGGGIFNIPQNMAAGASAGAVMLSWLLTGIGVFFLILTFRSLSRLKPDLRIGIYQYAEAGFGRFAGFNMAWGYWLCVIMGNVTIGVMLNDSLGVFFPVLLNHGWPTLLLATCIIWGIFALVVHGLKTAAYVNTLLTIVKFATLGLVLVLMVIYFKVGMLDLDFWGNATLSEFSPLGSVPKQIRSTMMVTMFCFLGIESVVMMTSHSTNTKDVARASMFAFILALVLYFLVSLLSFGLLSQPELAALEDPSMAYLLRMCAGGWSYYFVIASIIFSVSISWISWTLICAETLYGGASAGLLPRQFMKLNRYGMPAYGLVISSVLMSLFMVLVCTAPNVYIAALDLSILLILPVYLFCALYLCKLSVSRKKINGRDLAVGVLTTIYCLWCIYSGGILLLLATSIFYAVGLVFFRMSNRQRGTTQLPLVEKVAIMALLLISLISVWFIYNGTVRLN